MQLRSVLAVASSVASLALASRAAAAPCNVAGPDLILTGAGASCSMSGVHTFGTVSITGGAVVTVDPYAGGDKALTGNLELRANTITVDATSRIDAKGRGYQTRICGDGQGPTAAAAGQGGCAVRDSGGGGAHFGGGGRGTKDISPPSSSRATSRRIAATASATTSTAYRAAPPPATAATTTGYRPWPGRRSTTRSTLRSSARLAATRAAATATARASTPPAPAAGASCLPP
jgi:hypothetical protein